MAKALVLYYDRRDSRQLRSLSEDSSSLDVRCCYQKKLLQFRV